MMWKTNLDRRYGLLLISVAGVGFGTGCAPIAADQTPATVAPPGAPDSRPVSEPPADNADQCPDTPAGTVELAHGCSAVELARRPERVFGAALAGLRAASRLLGADSFAGARVPVDDASSALREASASLARGDVCAAVDPAQRADRDARAIEALTANVLARTAAAHPGDAEGHDPASTQGARLELQAALAQRELRAVHDAAASAGRLCESVAGSFERRARIARIDARAGLLHLDDGTLVALAPAGDVQHAFAGREALVTGLRFADGSALAARVDDAVAIDPAPTGAAQITLIRTPCLTLRAVPIQSGYPYTGASFPQVDHALAGYRDASNTLRFEDGIGLTPLQQSPSTTCPTYNPTTNRAIVYSVGIVENVDPYVSFTLVSDMHDGDGEVFPSADSDFVFNTGHSITATFYQRECSTIGGVGYCTTPTVVRTETYGLQVADQGTFASVAYDSNVVGVVDQQAGYEHNLWYDTLHPTSFATSPSFPAASDVVVNAFSAEGWRRYADGTWHIDPIHIGTDFTVYTSDWTSIWSDPATVHPLDNVGQDRPSGLRWAHVEGTRGGWPFWYSTRTPQVVRDRIATCATVGPTDVSGTCGNWPATTPAQDTSAPNPRAGQPVTLSAVNASFYELPYAAGWQSSVGNANIDDPAPGHRHGCNQIGAYDFDNSLNTPLLAARGGTVIFVEEGVSMTCVCYGNRVFIRHQDGSMAVYYHEVHDGVIVNVGDVVHRGQQIGFVGQTGNASAPHVHFESLFWESSDWGGLRSLFRARVGSNTATPTNCYLPRATDTFFSTTVMQ